MSVPPLGMCLLSVSRDIRLYCFVCVVLLYTYPWDPLGLTLLDVCFCMSICLHTCCLKESTCDYILCFMCMSGNQHLKYVRFCVLRLSLLCACDCCGCV